MKIEKYTKDKGNKYKVIIDSEEYTFYDDVIIKYELLRKNSISSNELEEILRINEEMTSYYDAIKYISRKMRSEYEVREYLKKKSVNENIINDTVKRLKTLNMINDEIYVKAFINDQINLSNHGPLKIKNNLIKLNIDENLIDEYLLRIDALTWKNKIAKYIEKKIKVNKNTSAYMLKVKIVNDLVNLGYNKETIMNIISEYSINDNDAYKKEYEKAKKQYEKKYSGYELERKIKDKMYRKGFRISDFEE